MPQLGTLSGREARCQDGVQTADYNNPMASIKCLFIIITEYNFIIPQTDRGRAQLCRRGLQWHSSEARYRDSWVLLATMIVPIMKMLGG